jgi:tRNA(Ile)-lysidine synthase
MASASDRSGAVAAIERSGLVAPGARVLVMLSGGADSVCLLHALRELIGAERLHALHVNHGLRAAADEDERFCQELCASLGVALTVEHIEVHPPGNMEASAREGRYAAAEVVREREGLDLIASAHTASDQVETILYRLVSSRGRRALLGMRARRGRLVRPLLELTSDDMRAYCVRAGLSWREDETNEDVRYARNRLRLRVLPELRLIHAGTDANVLATAAELADEAEVLDRAVDEAIERLGAGGAPPALEWSRLATLPPALRRLVVRRLAEEAAGEALPLGGADLERLERLAASGGTAELDLGRGVRAVSEYGLIRFLRDARELLATPVELPVPGSCRFGEWELSCTLEGRSRSLDLGSPDSPALDAGLLARTLTVRPWEQGDRMRPLGLGGTKSLQDLFVDRKVPRSLRASLPVVESGGEIAWVAGVAVSETFKVTDRTTETARFDAKALLGGG